MCALLVALGLTCGRVGAPNSSISAAVMMILGFEASDEEIASGLERCTLLLDEAAAHGRSGSQGGRGRSREAAAGWSSEGARPRGRSSTVVLPWLSATERASQASFAAEPLNCVELPIGSQPNGETRDRRAYERPRRNLRV